jgi:hypothetical protein
MTDTKKTAEALGAAHAGHIEAKSGAFGAAQTLADIQGLKGLLPVPRYTAESVRASIEPHRERLFASYASHRPPGWACDPRTKDLVCLGNWLAEELTRLGCNDTDRRTQQAFYNRWSRSDEDLFDLGARTLNAVLDGKVEQNRIPHRRWG